MVGKTDFNFVAEGVGIYENRLKHYISFETIYIKDVKRSSQTTAEQLKTEEAKLILKQLTPDDYVVLLDENGQMQSSVKFASFIQTRMNAATKRLVFVIGGAYGFAGDVYSRANSKLSLSPMTFSHQIVRALFLEQLYRAFTIIKGEPYHHE
jgi:23S rRNA (pseudouridine1915-N3)-methyltransferase